MTTSMSDCLAVIERHSKHIVHEADAITRALRLMESRRDFETRAFDELVKAEQAIAVNLALIRALRDQYLAKPTKMVAAE